MGEELTGSIEDDAPALFSALTTILGPQAASNFSILYTKVAGASGLDEPKVTRSPDAGFNPRPSRLCTILIKDCRLHSSDVLAAAMSLCADADKFDESALSEFKEAVSILRDTRSLLRSEYQDYHSVSLVLALVYQLDLLRHLHMMTLSGADKIRELRVAEELLREADEDFIPEILKKKLETIIARQRANLNEE